jgi:hypothetical protein
MNDVLEISLKRLVVASALLVATIISVPRAAQADTASTIAIAAGAAAIVGALLIDGNNKPYYVNNNHRYYVTPAQASYYRGHHRTVERRAYVPEGEYPIANGGRR